MSRGRLEAFSDGVLAIIITIMVLEMKVPHGASMRDLLPLLMALIWLIPDRRIENVLSRTEA
jgi:uncharacterized membrane protein